MKRFLLSLFAAFALLAGVPGVAQVSVDASKTGTFPYAGTFAWTSKPASAANGTQAFITDLGQAGTWAQYSTASTRWRPINGTANLATLAGASANVTNTEAIVLQTLVPVNAWQTNDTVRVWLTATSSGTTDVCEINVRVGTAGTTSDTAITGLSAHQIMAAAGVSGGGIFDVKLISATSAQKLGSNTAANHSYQATSSTSAAAAATAINDASTTALYVSLSLRSGGTTNTCAATSAAIQLLTP